MYHFLAIYLPSIVCLVGFVFVLANRLETRQARLFAQLTLVGFLYFFADAAYVTTMESCWFFMVADIIGKISLPLLYPIVYLYIRSKVNDKPVHKAFYAVFAFSLIFGGVTIGLYCTRGSEEIFAYLKSVFESGQVSAMNQSPAIRCYYYISYWTFNIVSFLETIALLTYMFYQYINMLVLRHAGQDNRDIRYLIVCIVLLLAVTIVRVAMGFCYLLSHPGLSSALSFVMALIMIAICGLIYHDLLEQTVEIRVKEKLPTKSSVSLEQLYQGFEDFMFNKGWLFQEGTSAEKLIHELGTNRSFLSRMMQTYYGMDYAEWVRRQRILKAQELMRNDTEGKLTQMALAEMVGYYDAPAFSRTFKAETGDTPREWILKYRASQRPASKSRLVAKDSKSGKSKSKSQTK